MYAVKDTVQGEMMNPFLLRNNEEAKRTFAQAVNTPGSHNVAVYYKDMQLYKIGEFDSITGEIQSKVEYVCSGIDVKIETENKKENIKNGIQNN